MEQRVVNSLLKPSAYPETTGAVRLVQTHVSLIFLTDLYVYKVKKPVDFGFLNFTTLDRRRFYCGEEVRLNRRLCPDLYLGVVELRETPGGAAFHGSGKIIDYAVKMRRLPEHRMLNRLLDSGEVTGDDVRKIARTIASFHANAERSAEIDTFGSLEVVRQNWNENFQMVEGFGGETISGNDFERIRNWVDRFFAEHAGLFAVRVADGRIRDCDGDIHLENICLDENGTVYIFDCIEFNNSFRYCDTAADIAFLLMDFDYHCRRDFTSVFLEEYLAVSQDHGLIPLLDFYRMNRAFIRGKVETLRLFDPLIDEQEKNAARARASRHFRLARGYALSNSLPKMLIITCGLTGSGKSTIARELSFELGMDIISSDAVRKELAGVPANQRHTQGYAEGIYGAENTKSTYDEMLRRCSQRLARGESVIADATFRNRESRDEFRRLARLWAVPFLIIFAACPENIVKERLEARQLLPDELSDGSWTVFLRQKDEWEPFADSEKDVLQVDTTLNPAVLIDTIAAKLEAVNVA